MNAKTTDDLVKDIIREYSGFVVPARGFWPVNEPMMSITSVLLKLLMNIKRKSEKKSN